jgi:acetyl esterase/lipase
MLEHTPNITLPLWPNRQQHSSQLKLYLPGSHPNTELAIVIVPGGSYRPGPYGWCKKAEGSDIAFWLSTMGVLGVVLEYRLPAGRPEVPLADALRAISIIRERAAAPTRRIGIMGFSAGGHLAALAATSWSVRSERPDLAVLVYPVITLRLPLTHANTRREYLGRAPDATLVDRYSAEQRVTPRTPPTLLLNARDDRIVDPANARLYYEACAAHGVRCRRVELASGGHPFVDKPHAWGPAKRAIVEWLRTASSGASAAGEVAGARAGAAGAGHRSPAIAAVQDTGT